MPPRLDDRARFPEAAGHVLVKALVAQLAVERFDECVLHRLARFDVVPRPFWLPSAAQHSTTGELVRIVANPLSGSARSIVSRSSSRTTLTPPSEVSTTAARHSRLKSSTMHRMRKRRLCVANC